MKAGFFLLLLLWPALLLGAEAQDLPVYKTLPEFQLTAQNGQAFGSADLDGKVWIADFIFTRCAGICPLMSTRMRALQTELEPAAGVRFVSISVDPEHDTPEVLQEYAKKYGAEAGRWYFLTGPKAKIFEMTQRDFMLGVGDVPEADRENAGQMVQHSSKFVLVDGEGRVRGFYDSDDESALKKLVKNAENLAG